MLTPARYRPRFGMGLRCKNCMNEFVATRKDAKFCGARCRKEDQRIREKADRLSKVLVSKGKAKGRG